VSEKGREGGGVELNIELRKGKLSFVLT